MKIALVVATALLISSLATAQAQNTKGTGAESATSTTTNPSGPDRISPPGDQRSHAAATQAKSGANDKATSQAEKYYEGNKSK